MRTGVETKIQIEMTAMADGGGGGRGHTEKHNLDISWFKYAD